MCSSDLNFRLHRVKARRDRRKSVDTSIGCRRLANGVGVGVGKGNGCSGHYRSRSIGHASADFTERLRIQSCRKAHHRENKQTLQAVCHQFHVPTPVYSRLLIARTKIEKAFTDLKQSSSFLAGTELGCQRRLEKSVEVVNSNRLTLYSTRLVVSHSETLI